MADIGIASSPLARLRGAIDALFDPVSPRLLWTIYWAAAASFIPLLFLQYVGEEAVYPIAAQEMLASSDFLHATVYGASMGRPGVFVWLIVAITKIIGVANVLIAARLIAAMSTLLLGLVLAWLVRRLFNDRLLAALAAAIFMSGDVLLQRGWLAYVDPLYALMTFTAMACLWIAAEERRRSLLVLAALALMGAFLAKALTAYVFYGVLALVLLWRHPNRWFLLSPLSIAANVAALAFPLVWNGVITGDSLLWGMLDQVNFNARNDAGTSLGDFVGPFVVYPFRVLWYLAPTSVIVLYALLSRRTARDAPRRNSFLIALIAVAINILPYWFAPRSAARYLLPIYPLLALTMAYIVVNSGRQILDWTLKALAATIAIAYVAALIGFPVYERVMRGSYDRAA